MKILSFIENNSGRITVFAVVIALVLAVISVWDESPIVDEIPHIGAGYSYIARGDHRLNPEHPPLAKDLAGLGVALSKPTETAFNTRFWKQDINGQWEFGRFLIFNSGSDTEKLIKFAKLPQLLFFILLAWLIYIWSKRLYGKLAAVITIVLFTFSPTVLAHSRFVTTDMAALFGTVLSFYFFIRYLESPTRKNFLIAGLAFGVGQLTKYSLFLLNPIFLFLGILYGLVSPVRGKSRLASGIQYGISTIVLIAVGFIFIVWPIYYAHVINYPPELQQYHTDDILRTFGRRNLADPIVFFADKPIIRGLAQYGLGLLMVIQRASGGNTTYFMGEVNNQAWKEYFPIVYFIKEPLAFWGLVFLAIAGGIASIRPGITFNISRRIRNIPDIIRRYYTEFAMLLWIAVYWYTSITSNLNIGVRHLMPVYGFTFILLAGALTHIAKRINPSSALKAYWSIIMVFLGWYMLESLKVFPYYLTYYNQVAGGPTQGFRYVTDSNIDWGQDLKRLTSWVNDNNIDKIYLDYFGWSDQNYYLKDKVVWIGSTRWDSKEEFLNEFPEGGFIAISATFYMGSSASLYDNYNWLPLDERVTTIGNSIFIWEVR